ncbi:hypothetical protein LJC53_00355 [Bacteroidales bacterium OttesenSCG-928-C03]|nr:hypothetical protein [Bacteroidales bacterium OttesenSCG-928-C03]
MVLPYKKSQIRNCSPPFPFTVALTNTTFSQITWKAEPANIFQSATGTGQTANLQLKSNITTPPANGSITFYLGHGCDNTYRVTKQFTLQSCPTTNFINQTVNANRLVSGCNIYSRNVTVINNAKLIIDALREVTIERDFEIPLGSQLEIR